MRHIIPTRKAYKLSAIKGYKALILKDGCESAILELITQVETQQTLKLIYLPN